MSDKGEQMSSILDDAREKIAKELYYMDHLPEIHVWEKSQMQEFYLLRANQILAISGTTDIECPDCEGYRSTFSEFSSESCMDCTTCGNTSVIPYKWKVSIVLENGELPSGAGVNITFKADPELTMPAQRQVYDTAKMAYLQGEQNTIKAGYVQKVGV